MPSVRADFGCERTKDVPTKRKHTRARAHTHTHTHTQTDRQFELYILDSCRSVVFDELRLRLHIGRSVVMRLSGILNVECAVFPFDSSCAVMPLLATARATNPLDLRRARERLIW